MGFANAVVGGITLVRAAIRSPNYVAGVSGWTINRDGSVEFNDAVIRGDLQIGATPPNRFIGDTIPAELVAWGTPKGVTFFVVDIWYYDNSPLTYFFDALADFSGQLLKMNGTYDTNNTVYVWDRQFILGAGNLERRVGSSSLNTFSAHINYQQVDSFYAIDAPVEVSDFTISSSTPHVIDVPGFWPENATYLTTTQTFNVPSGYRGADVIVQAAGGSGGGAVATGAATASSGPGGGSGAFARRGRYGRGRSGRQQRR